MAIFERNAWSVCATSGCANLMVSNLTWSVFDASQQESVVQNLRN